VEQFVDIFKDISATLQTCGTIMKDSLLSDSFLFALKLKCNLLILGSVLKEPKYSWGETLKGAALLCFSGFAVAVF